MSGTFTPTPELARAWYCAGVAQHEGLAPTRLPHERHERIHGEFDRMLDEERRTAAEKALEPVRALHTKHENTLHTEPSFVCSHRHCVDDAGDQCAWPCPTIRALDSKETNA